MTTTRFTRLAAGLAVLAPLLVLGFAAPLLVLGALAARADEPFKMVSVDEVSRQLGTPGFHVFDANGQPLYEKSHVPGAVHVSYKALAEKDLPADRDARLVFYCKDKRWMASHQAARRAAELGWKNVFVMEAGIDGWIAAGKPVEQS